MRGAAYSREVCPALVEVYRLTGMALAGRTLWGAKVSVPSWQAERSKRERPSGGERLKSAGETERLLGFSSPGSLPEAWSNKPRPCLLEPSPSQFPTRHVQFRLLVCPFLRARCSCVCLPLPDVGENCKSKAGTMASQKLYGAHHPHCGLRPTSCIPTFREAPQNCKRFCTGSIRTPRCIQRR